MHYDEEHNLQYGNFEAFSYQYELGNVKHNIKKGLDESKENE